MAFLQPRLLEKADPVTGFDCGAEELNRFIERYAYPKPAEPGIVAGKVIVDLKAKEQVTAIDKLKVLTYLRLLNLRLGLVINFHVAILKDGIYRVVNNLIPRDVPPEPPTSVPKPLRPLQC